jgi:hypothetical protein
MRGSSILWEWPALSTTIRNADNLAQDYMTFDDASPVRVPRPHMADGTLMNAAGGCVTDLLTYYAALMSAAKDQLASGKSSTEGSPLKQVAQLLSSAICAAPSLREGSYACGWAHTAPRRAGRNISERVATCPPWKPGASVAGGVSSRNVSWFQQWRVSFPRVRYSDYAVVDFRGVE